MLSRSEITYVVGMVGADVQHWVAPRLFIAGGGGLWFVTGDGVYEPGCALEMRAGLDVIQRSPNALQVAVEAQGGLFQSGLSAVVVLQVGWQRY